MQHLPRTRRVAIASLLTLVPLAACSDDADGASGGDGDTPSAVEGTRTVDGAYGPIEIPAEPQRIVADLMTVDYLTALGFDTSHIVGVFGAEFYQDADEHYLDEFFDGTDVVDPGFQFEANLEEVAALDPDLILLPFDQIDGAENQDELADIAPLLVVPTSDTQDPAVRYGGTASFQDWRTTLRTYGDLLELDDEAEEFITETDQQLEALRAEHGDLIGSISATEAKSTPDYMAINALSEAGESGVLGTILMSELGFTAPAAQAAALVDEYGTVELSAENLALLDGDLLFLEVREGSTEHEESPLWPTLEVVKAGHVVVVGNHWEFGGAVAAREVIADIDEALDAYAAG
jgi:iron complex transport system substrate-binding protein